MPSSSTSSPTELGRGGGIARNWLHAVWRLPILLIWMIGMPLLFFLLKALRIRWYAELPHIFHNGVQRIFGMRVSFSGELSEARPTLYVSNHISYLDIFALGGIRAFYVAKSEVAGWPVLGQLARFQNTLFIERAPSRAREQLKILQHHLAAGNSLILFPEGTSTDGVHVEPFKSSLFAAASMPDETERVPIQPITVAYTHHDGRKMDQEMRDYYAWYATMPFTSHFFALFALKKVDVKVHFHPVCYLEQFDTRKACANHCFSQVNEKLLEFVN